MLAKGLSGPGAAGWPGGAVPMDGARQQEGARLTWARLSRSWAGGLARVCFPSPAANPKDDPNATPIYEVEDISRLTADTSTRGTQWGTGGMATKLTAGRIATAAGCTMVICNSTAPENIVRIVKVRTSPG